MTRWEVKQPHKQPLGRLKERASAGSLSEGRGTSAKIGVEPPDPRNPAAAAN